MICRGFLFFVEDIDGKGFGRDGGFELLSAEVEVAGVGGNEVGVCQGVFGIGHCGVEGNHLTALNLLVLFQTFEQDINVLWGGGSVDDFYNDLVVFLLPG